MKLKMPYGSLRICPVAPLAGARIEILSMHSHLPDIESLPSRERGLKLLPENSAQTDTVVAPLAGARIEMRIPRDSARRMMSLPSWERGLKCFLMPNVRHPSYVAPLVGARIEIVLPTQ